VRARRISSSGHFAPHAALEAELAAFVRPCEGAQALLFSTGYLANLAILTALAGRDDAIFADKLNHACLNDGALLSRATLVRYPHRDIGQLRTRIASSTARRKLIATDAVFSMDGDLAPLPELLSIADEFDAWLVIDDAHGFGVLGSATDPGRGTAAHFGIASERIISMGTLGKAAGVAGAFVAAHPAVIDTLLQTARPYIFTTAAPPLLAETARVALQLIRNDRARYSHLTALIEHFRTRMRTLPWKLPPVANANPAAAGWRQCLGTRIVSGAVAARLLGAGDPPADRPCRYRPVADHAYRRAHPR
jgi:8-amino-7-oxononanoate synthase